MSLDLFWIGCLRALILLVGAWPSGPVPSRDFNCPRVLRAMILLVGAWPSGPVPSFCFCGNQIGSVHLRPSRAGDWRRSAVPV